MFKTAGCVVGRKKWVGDGKISIQGVSLILKCSCVEFVGPSTFLDFFTNRSSKTLLGIINNSRYFLFN